MDDLDEICPIFVQSLRPIFYNICHSSVDTKFKKVTQILDKIWKEFGKNLERIWKDFVKNIERICKEF